MWKPNVLIVFLFSIPLRKQSTFKLIVLIAIWVKNTINITYSLQVIKLLCILLLSNRSYYKFNPQDSHVFYYQHFKDQKLKGKRQGDMLKVAHTNTAKVFLLQMFTMKLRSQSELYISGEKSLEEVEMHRVSQKLVNTDISYLIFLNMFFLIHIFQNKTVLKNRIRKKA